MSCPALEGQTFLDYERSRPTLRHFTKGVNVCCKYLVVCTQWMVCVCVIWMYGCVYQMKTPFREQLGDLMAKSRLAKGVSGLVFCVWGFQFSVSSSEKAVIVLRDVCVFTMVETSVDQLTVLWSMCWRIFYFIFATTVCLRLYRVLHLLFRWLRNKLKHVEENSLLTFAVLKMCQLTSFLTLHP